MRLWSLHPRYLERAGLTALWREGLLARAVIGGRPRGYRHHPQLERFLSQDDPEAAISAYLAGVHQEASERGYAFDPRKLDPFGTMAPIYVTRGQLEHEWRHLMRKLLARAPLVHEQWMEVVEPECHPLFHPVPGPVERWERVRSTAEPS